MSPIEAGRLAGTFGLKKGDRVSVIVKTIFEIFEIKFACMPIGPCDIRAAELAGSQLTSCR